MSSLDQVVFDRVSKELKKLPQYIRTKLIEWARAIELQGIRNIRRLPGYHDEPLLGERFGQRSIRLSKSYRAIYKEEKNGVINLIIIIKVNKHEY